MWCRQCSNGASIQDDRDRAVIHERDGHPARRRDLARPVNPVCETLAKSLVKRRCLLRWSALTRELKTRLLAAGGVLEVGDNTVAASSRSRDAVAE
jgi:hypothetical protein